MIDGLRRAFSEIYANIPLPVLQAAFDVHEFSNISLDELIKQRVLLARVRDDVSIRGGKLFQMILNLDWALFTSSPSPFALGVSGSYSSFRIPASARENRDIACVMSVRFPYTIGTSSTGNFYNTCSVKGDTMGGLACASLQSQTNSNMLSYPTGEVLPGNVIHLNPAQYNFTPWEVIVRLCYDDDFSGMDVSSIRPFCEVCLEAVKQYCYTNLMMKIESNLVFRGAEIGYMRTVVESYSDAGEKYNEALLRLGGAELYQPQRLQYILRRVVPHG
jgi:hypothetical protein